MGADFGSNRRLLCTPERACGEQAIQRITFAKEGDFLRLPVVVAFRMCVQTVSPNGEKCRLAFVSHMTNSLVGNMIEVRGVPSVGLEVFDAESLSTTSNGAGHARGLRGRLRVQVIFADEQLRHLPKRSEIQRFVQHAFAQSALPDE
jgi:hypothetical protein